MSETWARAVLKTYRIAGAVIHPFSGSFLRYRARAGKEDPARRSERFGYASVPRPKGPLVWFHAASVGESMAVLPLLQRIEGLGINIVLTTGTVTSAEIMQGRLSSKTIHQYVPMDIKPMIKRFLDHWKPDLAIFAESEIWPMTILELGVMRVPLVLVNARLSDRSYKRWRKYSGLAEALYENMAHVIAQSEIDGRRFEELGAKKVTVSGNLKVDTGMPHFDGVVLARLMAQIAGRPVWIAVSTHSGEEELVADTHQKLLQYYPNLLTIIVPRHPARGNEVAAMLAKKGLNVSRRSLKQPVLHDTAIFLGDTIGEMGLFLATGEIAFVGNSLTSAGGHNPLEPAVTGTAILSGPNVQNFRSSYEALIAAGGARLVRDQEMLFTHVAHLLTNTADRQKMIVAAQQTVKQMSGSLDKTFSALDYYINPLRMKARLEKGSENISPEQSSTEGAKPDNGQGNSG